MSYITRSTHMHLQVGEGDEVTKLTNAVQVYSNEKTAWVQIALTSEEEVTVFLTELQLTTLADRLHAVGKQMRGYGKPLTVVTPSAVD